MFEENLKKLRIRKNLSQEALAEKLGVTRQTIAKWELGESTPDIMLCVSLAELFGVSLDDLVHYDEAEKKLPLPPKGKHMFGVVKVGERGQIVIPKKARDIFHIAAGDSLIMLGDETQGLALMKMDDMVEFVERAMRGAEEK